MVPFKGLRPAPAATTPRDERPGLSGLTADELRAWFVERGEPAFRARQVMDAVWGNRHASLEDVTTLPAALQGGRSTRRSGSTPSTTRTSGSPTAA